MGWGRPGQQSKPSTVTSQGGWVGQQAPQASLAPLAPLPPTISYPLPPSSTPRPLAGPSYPTQAGGYDSSKYGQARRAGGQGGT